MRLTDPSSILQLECKRERRQETACSPINHKHFPRRGHHSPWADRRPAATSRLSEAIDFSTIGRDGFAEHRQHRLAGHLGHSAMGDVPHWKLPLDWTCCNTSRRTWSRPGEQRQSRALIRPTAVSPERRALACFLALNSLCLFVWNRCEFLANGNPCRAVLAVVIIRVIPDHGEHRRFGRDFYLLSFARYRSPQRRSFSRWNNPIGRANRCDRRPSSWT